MAPKERIEELREKLNEYNRLYYVENTPAVSDRQFDEMLRELQELEQRYPEYYDVNSPTQRVGSDMTNRFEAVRHRYPMMSLANTYSLEELREFYDRVTKETGRYGVRRRNFKFDGTAISLTYEEGRLVRAVTRGVGTMGDDVTAQRAYHTQYSAGTLRRRLAPVFRDARGDIYAPCGVCRLNREKEEIGEQPFANPRNAAAGH